MKIVPVFMRTIYQPSNKELQMKVTKVNLRTGKGDSSCLAFGSVELDNMMVVRKMAVFSGKNGNPPGAILP